MIKHKRKIIILLAIPLAWIGIYGITHSYPPLPTNSVLSAQSASIDVLTLWQNVNAERTKAGLPGLVLDPELNQSATAKCSDINTYSYWAHNNPNGTTWQSFIAAYQTYINAGENLASDYYSNESVVTGWMNSPEHKANILNQRFDAVGYAVCGKNNIVVQHFIDTP